MRPVRHAKLLAVTMRTARLGEQKALLRNISEKGLCAKAAMLRRSGEAVEFTIRGIGVVPGEVRWVRGQYFGVEFERAIDPHDALARSDRWDKIHYIMPVHMVLDVHRPASDFRRPGLKLR